MHWAMEYRPEQRVVWVRTEGRTTTEDVARLEAECARTAREHGARGYLFDHRALETFLSDIDIYDGPSRLEKVEASRAMLAAILIRDEKPMLEAFAFLADVMNNRGFVVRLFTDELKAFDWLEKEGRPSPASVPLAPRGTR
ncbi:MAG: hypothetical protein IT349_01615 [Candidatus Eisenbacteria bacterium]|nr:hypothetical protein [Candidatus Eisenbacteria bacterium]